MSRKQNATRGLNVASPQLPNNSCGAAAANDIVARPCQNRGGLGSGPLRHFTGALFFFLSLLVVNLVPTFGHDSAAHYPVNQGLLLRITEYGYKLRITMCKMSLDWPRSVVVVVAVHLASSIITAKFPSGNKQAREGKRKKRPHPHSRGGVTMVVVGGSLHISA